MLASNTFARSLTHLRESICSSRQAASGGETRSGSNHAHTQHPPHLPTRSHPARTRLSRTQHGRATESGGGCKRIAPTPTPVPQPPACSLLSHRNGSPPVAVRCGSTPQDPALVHLTHLRASICFSLLNKRSTDLSRQETCKYVVLASKMSHDNQAHCVARSMHSEKIRSV